MVARATEINAVEKVPFAASHLAQPSLRWLDASEPLMRGADGRRP
jgi:hypothetical protein